MLYTVRTPKQLENNAYSYRKALCLGDEELHWDGGEPEDNTFGRDWGWVPGLLNKERSRWIELQAELAKFVDEKWSQGKLDGYVYMELKSMFCNRFDEGKE